MDQEIFHRIRDWAKKRDLYKKGDSKTQVLKLMEEVGELAEAVIKRNDTEVIDAVGDCVIVLTSIIELYEIERDCHPNHRSRIEECIEASLQVIEKRKGKMINGNFVKNVK